MVNDVVIQNCCTKRIFFIRAIWEVHVCFLYLVPSSTCYKIGDVQVGSSSMQGAGAPTMFQAMRRIVDSLMHQSMGEGALERAINSSFLGKICVFRGCWMSLVPYD